MSSIKFPEPHFPLELERLIFELALTQNGIRRASTPLSLVAKRVCEWLRPLIFRVVNLTPSTVCSNYKLPQSTGPYVQHFIINSYFMDEPLSSVLSSCPNIINLAIKTHFTNFALQEMSHLTSVLHDKSPIQNLTHLTIHGAKADSSWRNWEFLAHLSKLTHINADKAIQSHIPKVLLLCPFLKLLVVEFFDSYKNHMYGRTCYRDDRLVFMARQIYSDYVLDWERGANGGVDTWIFAERLVFARIRKYFARSLPPLIPKNLEWKIYLNEDGKKWFHELGSNGPFAGLL